jgi:polysaccharide biosynthesis transport protein
MQPQPPPTTPSPVQQHWRSSNLELSSSPRLVSFPAPPDEGNTQSAGSMLIDSWYTIQRHWKLISSLAGAGLLLALLFTLSQTPKYRAFALLEVRPLNGEFLDLKAIDPTSSGPSDNAETEVQTQVKIIQSQPVTIRTMERMTLYTRNKTSTTQNYWSGMLSTLGLFHPSAKASTELLPAVEKSMRVRSLGPTRVIQLTAESTDPFVAQLYVNTLADEYRAQTIAAREINSTATGDWLTDQLKTLRSNLDSAQGNLEKFARQNSLMFLSESSQTSGPSVDQQRLQQLESDLAHAQADRIAKQAAVEQTTVQNPDSLPPVLDNGPIRDYELKLADLRRQWAEISSTLKPTHPTAIRIQNQIKEVTATIQREKSNVLGRLKAEFESAQRRENLLNLAYRAQVGIVNQQQAKLIRYNSLRGEVESNQSLYEAMQRKVTEAHIAAALHASPVRIVNPAMHPDQPVSPNWPISLIGGLIGGLTLGICAAFIVEGADSRIRAPGEIASSLGVRELGSIPNARSATPLVPDRPLPLLSDAYGWQGRKANALSDSFRSVLQSILILGADGTSTRLITVTSPEPGDGKSSVAGSLAQALSELGKTVLLLDCDLRCPSLHKSFHLENKFGISDLLNGPGPIDTDTVRQYATPTRLPGVSLMMAGSPPDSIPLTLAGDRMRRLLKLARETYDMVIVDSPPILQGPDARIMGRSSDGLILVIRAGKTSFTAAQGAKTVLHQDNIPVFGVILNDCSPHETSYYSSYRSAYSRA